MKKAIIILVVLVMAATAWAVEKPVPDFGWWFEPGSPQAVGCNGQGVYMYAYGTPDNHETEWECGTPDFGECTERNGYGQYNCVYGNKKKEKSFRLENNTHTTTQDHGRGRHYHQNVPTVSPSDAHDLNAIYFKEKQCWWEVKKGMINVNGLYKNGWEPFQIDEGRGIWLKRKVCE